MTCVIENEELAFAESKTTVYLWLKTSNKFIPFSELENCKWGDNTKFVLNVVNEPFKTKSLFKKSNLPTTPFYTKIDYPEYNLTFPEIYISKSEPSLPKPPEESLNDIFVGGVASVALLLSVIQQLKQKKKESESANCCAKIQHIESEFNKIQQESKESNKTLHAEIIEQYKEMKELKEDATEVKKIISKIIDKLPLGDQDVKKRTED